MSGQGLRQPHQQGGATITNQQLFLIGQQQMRIADLEQQLQAAQQLQPNAASKEQLLGDQQHRPVKFPGLATVINWAKASVQDDAGTMTTTMTFSEDFVRGAHAAYTVLIHHYEGLCKRPMPPHDETEAERKKRERLEQTNESKARMKKFKPKEYAAKLESDRLQKRHGGKTGKKHPPAGATAPSAAVHSNDNREVNTAAAATFFSPADRTTGKAHPRNTSTAIDIGERRGNCAGDDGGSISSNNSFHSLPPEIRIDAGKDVHEHHHQSHVMAPRKKAPKKQSAKSNAATESNLIRHKAMPKIAHKRPKESARGMANKRPMKAARKSTVQQHKRPDNANRAMATGEMRNSTVAAAPAPVPTALNYHDKAPPASERTKGARKPKLPDGWQCVKDNDKKKRKKGQYYGSGALYIEDTSTDDSGSSKDG